MGATLGFGDSVGGRATYPFSERALVPARPTLDSLIDVPHKEPVALLHPNPKSGENIALDERQFVTVLATAPEHGEPGIGPPLYAWGRAAIAKPGDYITVGVWIANGAPPNEDDCRSLVGPRVATNVRVRVALWESPDWRRHVIRVWIEGGPGTYPAWVTDAVPVLTTTATELQLVPAMSQQTIGNILDPVKWERLKGDSIMLTGGLQLGKLGACEANRRYLSLIFAQHRPEEAVNQ